MLVAAELVWRFERLQEPKVAALLDFDLMSAVPRALCADGKCCEDLRDSSLDSGAQISIFLTDVQKNADRVNNIIQERGRADDYKTLVCSWIGNPPFFHCLQK